MASPLPTLQYLVAFQNNAFDDPALITSVASPGVLGANNVWTDITSYVMSHTFDRGRQHELGQFEAGTCNLVLNNRDGRFSPYNTSSPYNGFLTVRKLFQLRQTWSGVTYTRFTGMVDAWPTDWPDQTSQWCSLHVSDAFRVFNLADITTGGYPSQVIADGATGYWRLGDLPGSTNVADSSGGGHTATTYSTAYGTDTFGVTGLLPADVTTSMTAAWNSVGPSGMGVNIPQVISNGATTATVEYWIQSTDNATTSSGVAVLYGTGASIVTYNVFCTSTTPSVFLRDNNTLTTIVSSAKNVYDGSPHHIVATVSASATTLYVDGVQVATSASVPSSGTNPNNTPANIITAFSTAGVTYQEVAVYNGTALTGTQVANHFNLASFPQESTDTRIGRVLNAIGWSSGARALDAGKSTVQKNTASLTSTSSLSHMQQVEGTEGGVLFMTGDGKVKFLARTTLQSNSLYTTSQQKIGDNTAGGDMPFQPSPQLALDDIDLFNEAVATRTGGLTQRATNSSSITSFGRNTWSAPATLIGISDIEVLNLTQYIVSKFNTPVVRVQSVTVDLLELITPNIVANLLSLDLLYQVTVERTVTPDGGTAFTQTANIERIHEQVTPDSWQVTFQLAKADPAWWILGTSQLGTSTTIAW